MTRYSDITTTAATIISREVVTVKTKTGDKVWYNYTTDTGMELSSMFVKFVPFNKELNINVVYDTVSGRNRFMSYDDVEADFKARD